MEVCQANQFGEKFLFIRNNNDSDTLVSDGHKMSLESYVDRGTSVELCGGFSRHAKFRGDAT